MTTVRPVRSVVNRNLSRQHVMHDDERNGEGYHQTNQVKITAKIRPAITPWRRHPL